MAELVKPDGSITVVTPGNGRRFTLEELHALVGGYIEVVKVPPWDGSRLAVCDEEGKLKEGALVNHLATLRAERHNFGDVAVGDWLFVERSEVEDDEDEK